MDARLVEANAVREDLDNPIAAAFRRAVLRRDIDTLVESLKASNEFGRVVVLVLVETGRECADFQVGLNGDLLEDLLSGGDVDWDAKVLALLCGSVANKE